MRDPDKWHQRYTDAELLRQVGRRYGTRVVVAVGRREADHLPVLRMACDCGRRSWVELYTINAGNALTGCRACSKYAVNGTLTEAEAARQLGRTDPAPPPSAYYRPAAPRPGAPR